ncbi:hypothetical protein [Marilutibacter aestuarii]|uniref:Uncharacterized protein n=1 Tax=Marilutibacter aestuarii TaxID=1706195 RepID=A0A508AGU7_9GAMM|nr:hypothetical protein [Lysobacter aestuarii]TQD47664.1 hypothetical protein FKV25_05480 [Lysobacter aestuarii]
MPIESVTQQDIDAAVARLTQIQGILTCVSKVVEEEVTGSPLWEASEALQASVQLLTESYCTLNEGRVVLPASEPRP